MNSDDIVENNEYHQETAFPEWAQFLFEPHTYKVAYGGRASSKSWTFARALLAIAGSKKTRVLCAREFQASIGESVHKLLANQIEQMGIGWFFNVQKQGIYGINGSEFIFAGIRNNPDKIRSTEGIDICWVEEAHSVSHKSWEILIPTIVRKPGSEIWVTFNPSASDDPTYKRFVLNTPPDCISKEVNFRQNPWFTEESKRELEYMRSLDIDAYNHIWEGKCAVHSNAQVFYGKWTVEDFEPDDKWDGPYHGVDWGFSQDPTVMIKCWIHDNRVYIEKEAWGLKTELDEIAQLFMGIDDCEKYVIRCDNSRPETISYLSRHGFPKIIAARKWPGAVEDGIARLRAFEKIIIHPRCVKTQDEFRLYSYKVDRLSEDILPDIIDKHNHCIDSLRYALNAVIDNTARIGKRNAIINKANNVYNINLGKNGWMS